MGRGAGHHGRGPHEPRRTSSSSAGAWPGSAPRSSWSTAARRSRSSNGGRGWAGPRGRSSAAACWFDNGQHVFLRCCTSYLAFLERIGASSRVHLQHRLDVPVMAPGGRTARLRRGRLPAPLHLGASLARYHHLSPERPRPARPSSPRAARHRPRRPRARHHDVRRVPRPAEPEPGGHRAAVGRDLHAHGQRARRRRLAPAGRHRVQGRPPRPRPPPATSAGRGCRSASSTPSRPAPRWSGAGAAVRTSAAVETIDGRRRPRAARGRRRTARRRRRDRRRAPPCGGPAPRRPRGRRRATGRSSGHHRSSTSTWCMTGA